MCHTKKIIDLFENKTTETFENPWGLGILFLFQNKELKFNNC